MQAHTQFNLVLVVISILVATFASYVSLNLSQNLHESKGRTQAFWLAIGAVAMGVGIWSMHFIGMLAFEMPGMDMAYDVPLMVLSMAVAIGASALAFYIVSRSLVPTVALIAGGVAMAVAIAGMHYIGMFSMRMGATIQWNLSLVALSVLIAMVASFGALGIFLRLRNRPDRIWELILASVIMGIAISGMHYTGMMAATFMYDENAHQITDANLLASGALSATVILATLLILGLSLFGSIAQKAWLQHSKISDTLLGRSEEKFRRLVEAVKDYAIFMLDTKGQITTWNMGAERINGYTDEEVIGKHVSIFYLPEDIENNTADHELEIATKTGTFSGEGRRVRKDGSIYWASIVITPVYEADGKISGFSKVIRDITESRASEKRQRDLNVELEGRVRERTEELTARENQLREITNAVPIMIAQIDKNEKVLFANESFCRWYALPVGQIIGKKYREVIGDERYTAVEGHVKQALNGQTVTFERHSVSGEGVNIIFNATFVPEYDSKGEVAGFILVATDVTKYKEIQEELKNAKEAAEQANMTKSAFLANMSHEIRTPLGAVIGFSELLLNENLSASDRLNSVEVIKRNGQLLSNIINDILDLSKVEAGKMELDKIEVPFTEVMKEIGTVLNLEAIEKGLELIVRTEGPVPSHICTDPLRLRQILVNLVGNAIKFTQRGQVEVTVKLLSNLKLAFIIKDTGEGIPADKAVRLFQPFTQADPSTTRKYGGTGLGLVLSRKLAQALGGDVVLTSSVPGKGSTFTVTIDPGSSMQLLFKSSAPGSERDSKVLKIRTDRPDTLHGTKILLVEDSRDNQQLIKRFLGFAGAVVEVANNGREGVEKASGGDYSLVLMDLQMPEMDGYEATKILREQGFKKPIIALTAHAMKEERERALASGFDDHITKPIDQKGLIKTLAAYASFETDHHL